MQPSFQDPYEFITSIRPDLSHIRRFGAKSYVHVTKKKRKGKLVSRARVGYLVGFANGNSYKVYLPDTNSFVVSRDVEFDERSLQVRGADGRLRLLKGG